MKTVKIYQLVVRNNKTNYDNYLGCYHDFRVASKLRDTMQERMKEDKLDYSVLISFTNLYSFSEEDKKSIGL